LQGYSQGDAEHGTHQAEPAASPLQDFGTAPGVVSEHGPIRLRCKGEGDGQGGRGGGDVVAERRPIHSGGHKRLRSFFPRPGKLAAIVSHRPP
jgi:hypothetical protein